MKKTIFYSWQSDSDSKTNRNFIEECIKKAIKELNRESEFDIEHSIDKDTIEEGGTLHMKSHLLDIRRQVLGEITQNYPQTFSLVYNRSRN